MRRALTLAVFLLATPALAEPTPAEKETARELFRQGNDARAAGKPELALERYVAAHALAATPITALEAARAHVELGHLVAGRDLALSVARMPVAKNESARAREARAAAADLADALRARIATLTVVVEAPRAPSVTIDGSVVAAASPQRLDPGPHRITGRIDDGPVAEVKITLAEGATETVRLAVPAPAAPLALAPPPPPVPERPRLRPLLHAGIAGTAAFGIAGAITGAVAVAKAATPDCEGSRCTRAGLDDVSTGRTFATISTITLSLAVVCAGLGVYAYVAGKRPRPAGLAWRF